MNWSISHYSNICTLSSTLQALKALILNATQYNMGQCFCKWGYQAMVAIYWRWVLSFWTYSKFTLYQLHCVDCLVTGPYPFPKRLLQKVWSSAYSFKFQYFLLSLMSSSRCLHLPLLSIPYIFPTITCFIRQFLCKMLPLQLAFHCFIVFRMFLSSLILCNISFFT